MGEHDCLHETDWAIVKDHVGDMARDLKVVLGMLRGNGQPGLVTKLALQEQTLGKLHDRIDDLVIDMEKMAGRAELCHSNDVAIKRMWKLMMWGGGLMSSTLFAGLVKVVFFGG